MSIPYAFRKALEGKEPYLDKSERLPKKQAEFLLQNKNMKEKYLGACLDSCRWGSQMTVMWEMNMQEMISFIRNWMEQNKDNFPNLFHERKIEELYNKFELPYIDHEICPRNKEHKGTIRDRGGKIRCAHMSEEKLKPNYITSYYGSLDELSQTRTFVCYEDKHSLKNPAPSDAFDENGILKEFWEETSEIYKWRLEEFEQEEATVIMQDICYAILSDKEQLLSLETIIKRLNIRQEFITVYCNIAYNTLPGECNRLDELDDWDKENYKLMGRCPGHKKVNDKTEFNFDGWSLAFYVQKWYEQLPNDQMPPFTEKERLRKAS